MQELFSTKALRELFPSEFVEQEDKTLNRHISARQFIRESIEDTKKRAFSPLKAQKRTFSSLFSSENTINYNDLQEISVKKQNRAEIQFPLILQRVIEQALPGINEKTIDNLLEDSEIQVLWDAKPRILGIFSTEIVFLLSFISKSFKYFNRIE